nr:MAG TPA: hypothetical protein [Caudoviricetes sp.]
MPDQNVRGDKSAGDRSDIKPAAARLKCEE